MCVCVQPAIVREVGAADRICPQYIVSTIVAANKCKDSQAVIA